MSSCTHCTDDARCDRLGLCQHVAKVQLPGPEPVVQRTRTTSLCEHACAERDLGGRECPGACILLLEPR